MTSLKGFSTMDTKPAPIFTIPPEKGPNRLCRLLLRPTHSLIERAMGLREIDNIYAGACKLNPEKPFSDRILASMGVAYSYSETDLAGVPKTGPVVIVANHPFGGVEGIVLLSLLRRVRPDVRVMANYILHAIPEMRDDFIFVDPFGSTGSARANLKPIKECMAWLKQGGLLIVFPAGEVSGYDRRANRVRDNVWSPSIAAIIRKTEATVVPMFFPGRNSTLFNAAGVIHPRLRTLMLVRQLINTRGRRLLVRIGSPLTWKNLEGVATDDAVLITYLRFRCYLLDERATRRQRRLFLENHPRALPQDPIIAPEPLECQLKEIEQLPPEAKLVESGDLAVYIARSSQIPSILREIGRLREITFRAVGEGTGNEIDLDDFDYYYNHAFLWNRVRQEVIGSYRLGLADEIVRDHGVQGLYTHTLFKFDERLMDRIQPAIEMGRSFIRPEYQKAYISLYLLWKGISIYIGQNPHYRVLFGPVSITNEYREASRGMILACMRQICMAGDLVSFVAPRIPPKPPRRAEWCMKEYQQFLGDLELMATLVAEIEPDHKDIPILLRQYLKLNGKLLSFNVDPEFSSVVDGLIMVELSQTSPKTLRRYMGNETADAYLRYHGIAESGAPPA
ncbi:MAG: lysophospholipid acyltransferase family protein [Lentisphaerae bacterium]|nr:lysophospholipid acyltransferase family protein [Lentisphaerota bacterium]